MIRETSEIAFEQIKREGLVSRRQFQVYDVLYWNGPLTATQIASKIPEFKSQSVGFNVHARLCELRDRGVVVEVGVIECPMTKRMVIHWDVTGNLPIPPAKRSRCVCKSCGGRGYIETATIPQEGPHATTSPSPHATL